MLRPRLTSALAALLAAALPAVAGAATPDPETTGPCTGVAFTDAAGDVTYSGAGNKDALDLTAAWLRYENGELKAYLRIKQLTVTEPDSSSGQRWGLFFKLEGSEEYRYVAAEYTDPTPGTGEVAPVSFTYGHSHEPETVHKIGRTNGRYWEGTDGLIELTIPDVGPGEEGRKLVDVHATALANVGGVDVHGAPTGATVVDSAPAARGSGVDLTVTSCPAKEEAPPTQEQAPSPAGPAPEPVAQSSRSYAPFVHLEGASAVDFLQPLRLRGRVWPSDPGQPVEILDGERVAAQTVTDNDGWFSALVRPQAAATYRARSAGVASTPLAVEVRPLVTLDLRETANGRLVASGRTLPVSAGVALVQRVRGGRFVTVRRLRVARGRFAAAIGAAQRGRYRVVLEPAGGGARSFSEEVAWR